MKAMFKGLLLIAGLAAGATPAMAKNVYVANNGTDNATCGAIGAPCRSISRGIAHALNDDTVKVGPGIYGEFDYDAKFLTSGEEAGQAGFGCDCVVRINKPLTVESTHGAGATLIVGPGTTANIVKITSPRVTFGGRGHGFTVIGTYPASDRYGTAINVAAFSGVIIEGNTLENSATGVMVNGLQHLIQNNRIAVNKMGADMHGNVALAKGNSVVANDIGLALAGDTQLVKNNAIVGNSVNGVAVNQGQTHEVTDNAVLGNQGPGVRIDLGCPGFLCSGAHALVTGNSIFGNDGVATRGAGNCGLSDNTNPNGVATNAENNYWGAASGPGSNPADRICGTGASKTDKTPFATTEINIPVAVSK